MASGAELERQFDQMVARREVLQGKRRLTSREQTELDLIEGMLGPSRNAGEYMTRVKETEQAAKDIIKGKFSTLDDMADSLGRRGINPD